MAINFCPRCGKRVHTDADYIDQICDRCVDEIDKIIKTSMEEAKQ